MCCMWVERQEWNCNFPLRYRSPGKKKTQTYYYGFSISERRNRNTWLFAWNQTMQTIIITIEPTNGETEKSCNRAEPKVQKAFNESIVTRYIILSAGIKGLQWKFRRTWHHELAFVSVKRMNRLPYAHLFGCQLGKINVWNENGEI